MNIAPLIGLALIFAACSEKGSRRDRPVYSQTNVRSIPAVIEVNSSEFSVKEATVSAFDDKTYYVFISLRSQSAEWICDAALLDTAFFGASGVIATEAYQTVDANQYLFHEYFLRPCVGPGETAFVVKSMPGDSARIEKVVVKSISGYRQSTFDANSPLVTTTSYARRDGGGEFSATVVNVGEQPLILKPMLSSYMLFDGDVPLDTGIFGDDAKDNVPLAPGASITIKKAINNAPTRPVTEVRVMWRHARS